MNTITVKYTPSSKMSDIIDTDYRILQLLNKFEIPLGFGEMTVENLCKKYQINTDCFLFLANLQSNKSSFNYLEAFNKLPLNSIIEFLQQSHNYFLDKRLPHLRNTLRNLTKELSPEIQTLILQFFDHYSNEVKDHMEYENNTVFPYIHSLMGFSSNDNYCIANFQEHHTDIEGKMADLSRIFTKYIQGGDYMEKTRVLIDIHMLQEELDSHTFIEEQLLIPRIKFMEKNI